MNEQPAKLIPIVMPTPPTSQQDRPDHAGVFNNRPLPVSTSHQPLATSHSLLPTGHWPLATALLLLLLTTPAAAGIPAHPDTYYIGSVGGGAWKSTNAGLTWFPIFDKQPIASIGAIEV